MLAARRSTRSGQCQGRQPGACGAFVSLIASAQLHGLNPQTYLRDLFRVLPVWPKTRMLELSPKHWRATRARLGSAAGDAAGARDRAEVARRRLADAGLTGRRAHGGAAYKPRSTIDWGRRAHTVERGRNRAERARPPVPRPPLRGRDEPAGGAGRLAGVARRRVAADPVAVYDGQGAHHTAPTLPVSLSVAWYQCKIKRDPSATP